MTISEKPDALHCPECDSINHYIKVYMESVLCFRCLDCLTEYDLSDLIEIIRESKRGVLKK